jgi:hypothetical protein
MDPQTRLLELDERYQRVLHSSDFKVRRQVADIQLEIDQLRIRYPNIMEKLEALYREAHPVSLVTTGQLLEFAIQRKLLLTGDPRPE